MMNRGAMPSAYAKRSTRFRTLTPAIMTSFVAATAVVLAAGVIGIFSLQNVYVASASIAHTDAVKAQLNKLLSTLVDAESGGRGFVITGRETYLEPYDRARNAIPSELDQARRLTADNPDQQTDVERLTTLTGVNLDGLAEAIRQRRESGLAAASAVVATEIGRRTMDEMRAIVQRTQGREDVVLAVRTAQADQSYRTALVTRIALTGLSLLAIILLFIVTSRSGQQQALVASQTRMLDSGFDAIILRDDRDRVIRWNRVAEQLYGWTAAEACGQVTRVLFNTIFPKPLDEITRDLHRDSRWEGELIHKRKDGTTLTVLSHWMLERDEQEKPHSVLEIDIDITDRKRAEERFHLAVDAAPNGMVLTDEAGKIVLVNAFMEKLFGHTREQMIGQSVEILVPERFRSRHRHYRQNFIGEPETRAMGAGRELYGLRKDGTEFPMEIGLNPIKTEHGSFILSAIVDITERKEKVEQRLELLAIEKSLATERALRETEAELARVLRALSINELATSIAHEVNQPLAGVIANAEAAHRWLSRETPNIAETKASIALIVRDGKRASAVIGRIREFLRKEPSQAVSLNIRDVIEEAVALVHVELDKCQVNVGMQFSPALALVRADRIQLQQVILNLLMNAADAMSSSEGEKALLITCQQANDGGVVVAVRDRGTGISPEQMNRMFDPFFTTKPTGTGMGLALSRSIIEHHGGKIWAKPNEGQGLTVQFRLPGAIHLSATGKPS